MKKIKSLFVGQKGDMKWSVLGLVFLVTTVFGLFFFLPETGYNFAHRFFRSAIFQVLGPVVGSLIFYNVVKLEKEDKIDPNTAWKPLLVGAVIFWAGLFGPVANFKLDREDSIPDEQVYYANGRVINAVYSSKAHYYFNQFKLSPVDSTYVVTYGEEPGYNHYGGGQHSTAPRANEDWTRPATKQAQKFEDGKRSK